MKIYCVNIAEFEWLKIFFFKFIYLYTDKKKSFILFSWFSKMVWINDILNGI